ncbi:MAG: hypothetical protein M0R51_08240 [Clostridia bacterium]|jgi:hypothetical protein|nr:hypothetical protein [Clostridia bacterium]
MATKTHVSLSQAASGHAAKTTASRNAVGAIVGKSSGSKYATEQEEKQKISQSTSQSGIQLKNGSYISQIQQNGQLNGNVKIYQSKAAMLQDKVAIQKAMLEREKLKAAFVPVTSKNGSVVASIQSGSGSGKGESGVQIVQYKGTIDKNGIFHKDSSNVVLSVSKTAKEYKTQERAQKQSDKVSSRVDDSLVSQAKLLYAAGKRIAAGKELTASQQAAVKKYSTTKEFKYSKLSEIIDTKGKAASKYLANVTKKDIAVATTEGTPIIGSVVKGIYDITEIPGGLGDISKGVERWAQAPKTFAPSLSVGTGMVVESVTSDPVRFATSLLTAKALGKVGSKTVGKVKIKSTNLQEVTPGEAAAVRDIKTGYTLAIGDKPIVSYSKATGKFNRGVAAASAKSIEGKQVQAFSKIDTKVFEKTLKQFDSIEQDYFKAGKTIASKVYKRKNPITKPKSLDILSEHVSESMKPVVKQTIVKYGSLTGRVLGRDVQVYGSVPQKLQMKGFFTRTPKDIEISVNSVDKFVSMFKKNANAKGFKEGVDYQITGASNAPKVEFKINGNWEKGIEVFSKKKSAATSIEAEAGVGYRSEAGIAYGFKSLKSIKADSVKMMKLQEQAARKFAGGTTLKEGKIDLMHGGRVKDVRDLIEIGTAYEVTQKIGIASDIIQYAKIAAKKHPDILDSPVVKYIVDNGKLPSKAAINKMNSVESTEVSGIIDAAAASEREVLFAARKLNVSKSVVESISKEVRASRRTAPYTAAVSKRVNSAENTSKKALSKEASSKEIATNSKSKAVNTTKASKSKSVLRASKKASVSKSAASKRAAVSIKSKKVMSKITPKSKVVKATSKPVAAKSKSLRRVSKAQKSTKTNSMSKPKTISKPTSKKTVSKTLASVSKPISKTATSKVIPPTKITKISEVKSIPKMLLGDEKKYKYRHNKNKGDLKTKRKIKNKLGNMKSMLG